MSKQSRVKPYPKEFRGARGSEVGCARLWWQALRWVWARRAQTHRVERGSETGDGGGWMVDATHGV